MIALDGSTVSPILYPLKTSFGVSERLIVWAINIEVMFLLIFSPIVAKLSDFFGRKKVYLFCTASFLAGLAIVFFSESYPVFLIGRALQGIGAGISVLAIILIGDNFTESRGTVLGIFGVAIGMVYATGPLVAGLLEGYDWHWVFAANIPVATALLLFCFFLLPEDGPIKEKKTADWRGVISLSVAIAAFSVFITGFGGFPLSWEMISAVIVCVAGIILFLHSEKKSPEKILPLDMLKRKNPCIGYALTLFGYLAGAGTYFFSTYAILAFGLSDPAGSYILIPFTVSSLIATVIIGKLLDITGPKPVLMAGGIISAAGMLILGTSQNITVFILSIILIGAGNASVAGNAIYYLMLEESGRKNRASAQGFLNILLNAGSLIGGAVLGVMLDSQTNGLSDFKDTYIALAFVYLALSALAALIDKKKKDRKENSSGV
ncbi:MFS family permease [Methanomicrobium sp. W14]|nr:MFS family permease [Methanomicrobium sp. W14]